MRITIVLYACRVRDERSALELLHAIFGAQYDTNAKELQPSKSSVILSTCATLVSVLFSYLDNA